jgi:hypothetical protein
LVCCSFNEDDDDEEDEEDDISLLLLDSVVDNVSSLVSIIKIEDERLFGLLVGDSR